MLGTGSFMFYAFRLSEYCLRDLKVLPKKGNLNKHRDGIIMIHTTHSFLIFLLWYLYRLKPQKTNVSSRFTAFSPRRNSLL